MQYYDALRYRKPCFLSNPPFSSISPAEPEDPDYQFQTSSEALSSLPFVMEEADKLECMNDFTPDMATRAQMTYLNLLQCWIRSFRLGWTIWSRKLSRFWPLYAQALSALSSPPVFSLQCPFTHLENQASFFIFSSSLIKIQYYYYAQLNDWEARTW